MGLGQSLLHRFEAGGFKAIGLVRSIPQQLIDLDLRQVDMTDVDNTTAIINQAIVEYGTPQVVIHNTAELIIKPFAQTQLSDFDRCWQSMVKSSIVLAQLVMTPMVQNGSGTFIVSGATASLRGGSNFSAFALAKFALRGLTQSLAR